MGVNSGLIKHFLESTKYQQVRTDVVNPNLIYVGMAESTFVLETDAKWLIFREIQVNGERIITYPGVKNPSLDTQKFNEPINIWANRAALSYGTYNPGDEDPYVPDEITVSGSVSTSGLSNGGKITQVVIDDTQWWPLPPTPLADRNQINIQNESGVEVKINHIVTPDPGYVGITIPEVGGERQYGIKDSIIIYARAKTGSVTIDVEELS